jgi:hypothetical protein
MNTPDTEQPAQNNVPPLDWYESHLWALRSALWTARLGARDLSLQEIEEGILALLTDVDAIGSARERNQGGSHE